MAGLNPSFCAVGLHMDWPGKEVVNGGSAGRGGRLGVTPHPPLHELHPQETADKVPARGMISIGAPFKLQIPHLDPVVVQSLSHV